MIHEKADYRAVQLLFKSYLSAILIGTGLLMMPWATCLDGSLGLLNSFFTATSAICVTGLTVVDMTYFTWWGQFVVLFLIQLGGIGILIFSTFFMIVVFQRISLSDAFHFQGMVGEITAKSVFRLIRHIFLIVLSIEGIGAALLMLFVFKSRYPFWQAMWYSVFHAISAFCNAGFSLYADSFVSLRQSVMLNVTIMALIVSGGLGFIVYEDIYRLIKKIQRGKRQRRLSVHTKIVFVMTGILIIGGALAFFILEVHNVDKQMPFPQKIVTALFQSVTARTAGFNTVPIAQLSIPTLIVLFVFMFIGGAPGSCAGGIKVTTAAIIFLLLGKSTRGRYDVTIFQRKIPEAVIIRALTLLLVSLLLTAAAVFGIILCENAGKSFQISQGDFLRVLFECISAYGTVGLSMGITPTLTALSKCILICLMFIGRLGPLSLGILFVSRQRTQLYELPEENILIG